MPLEVHFTDKPRAEFEFNNFPLPEKFGTHALILIRGKSVNSWQLSRVFPQPRADGVGGQRADLRRRSSHRP